jgi:hypothetical protein
MESFTQVRITGLVEWLTSMKSWVHTPVPPKEINKNRLLIPTEIWLEKYLNFNILIDRNVIAQFKPKIARYYNSSCLTQMYFWISLKRKLGSYNHSYWTYLLLFFFLNSLGWAFKAIFSISSKSKCSSKKIKPSS